VLSRSRLVVVVVVVVVGVGLGIRAFLWYDDASDKPDRPSFNGTVAIATNASNDQVEMIATGGTTAGAASTLNIKVNVAQGFPPRDLLLVAVGLSGHAKTDDRRTPPDGPLAATSDRPGQLTATGLQRPFFASGTSWPTDDPTSEEDDGQVLFGEVSDCMSDWCTVVVTVPMSRSMVESTGGTWTLSTPHLGAEAVDPDFPTLMEVEIYADGLAGEELDRLLGEEGNWYLPEEPALTFTASEDGVGDSVQQSGTPPVEAFGSDWKDDKPFAVDAVFERPRLIAQENTMQFLAGVFISLAVSLVVLAIDIVVSGQRKTRVNHGGARRSC
jgi:hypothetical protein